MNNYIFIYDGTLQNLLSTIKYLLKENIKPQNIIPEGSYTPNLFENIFKPEIKNDSNFQRSIINICSQKTWKIITYIFLSNNKNKEIIIYYFILNAFIYKDKILYHRNLKCVNMALKISKHVLNETHKLKGFTRFKMINNQFLYAEISPDNNIIELLSKHFTQRLKNELWIIKDTKRNILSIYNKEKYFIVSAEDINFSSFDTNNDILWQNLWKAFFKKIAIPERENRRCQMNFMPKKYWHNMIEMEEYYEKSN